MNILAIMGLTDWIFTLIRDIFLALDKVLYTCIELVYELLIKISEAGVFSQATIQEFANRIYVFLGLIMIFRVSISLVNYIINPEKFNDKKIGGVSLIKNSAFVLVMIVLIPYIFEAAYGLQRIILKDNVIGNLIMGLDSGDNDENSENDAEQGGKIIAFQIFSAFFTFNDEIASPSCINNPTIPNGDNKFAYNVEACGDEQAIGGVPFEGSYYDANDGLQEYKTIAEYMPIAYKSRDFRTLCDMDLAKIIYEGESGDKLLFDYQILVSSAVAIFVILLLLRLCIDIAVRSVKLGFLQLVAPVPLVMKIAPGEEGQKRFDKWVKECTKTYLDLFVRLNSIYFAIFVISAISRDGIQNVAGSQNNVSSDIFVRIFIIIGTLLFAQQLPILMYELIGGNKERMEAMSKKVGALEAAGAAMGIAGAVGVPRRMYARTRATQKKIAGIQEQYEKDHKGEKLDYNAAKNMAKYKKYDAPNIGDRLKRGALNFGYVARGTGIGATIAAKRGYSGGKGTFDASINTLKTAYSTGDKAAIDEGKRRYRIESIPLKDRLKDYVDTKANVVGSQSGVGSLENEMKRLKKEMDDLDKKENAKTLAYENVKSKISEGYKPDVSLFLEDHMTGGYSYTQYNNDVCNEFKKNYTFSDYCTNNGITNSMLTNPSDKLKYTNDYNNDVLSKVVSNKLVVNEDDFSQASFAVSSLENIQTQQRNKQSEIDKNNSLQKNRTRNSNNK